MKLISERETIRRIIDEYNRRLRNTPHTRNEEKAIVEAVAALNPETTTQRHIDKLFTNNITPHGIVRQECSECGKWKGNLVELGQERICDACIRKAFKMLERL